MNGGTATVGGSRLHSAAWRISAAWPPAMTSSRRVSLLPYLGRRRRPVDLKDRVSMKALAAIQLRQDLGQSLGTGLGAFCRVEAIVDRVEVLRSSVWKNALAAAIASSASRKSCGMIIVADPA